MKDADEMAEDLVVGQLSNRRPSRVPRLPTQNQRSPVAVMVGLCVSTSWPLQLQQLDRTLLEYQSDDEGERKKPFLVQSYPISSVS